MHTSTDTREERSLWGAAPTSGAARAHMHAHWPAFRAAQFQKDHGPQIPGLDYSSLEFFATGCASISETSGKLKFDSSIVHTHYHAYGKPISNCLLTTQTSTIQNIFGNLYALDVTQTL